MNHTHYRRLLLMAAVSFAAMYVLMYAMVDVPRNAYPNLNQLYMAATMTGAMIAIELGVMGSMYPVKRLSITLAVVGLVLTCAAWLAIRAQARIGDEQLIRSMIPHHAGAILMCERAELADPELKALCRDIHAAQLEEIERMKAILRRIDG